MVEPTPHMMVIQGKCDQNASTALWAVMLVEMLDSERKEGRGGGLC